MKKNDYTLLAFSMLVALYGVPSWADLQQQCLMGVPHFQGEVVQGDVNELPVYIEADRAVINQPVHARYEGDVEITQGNRYLKTQIAEVVQNGEKGAIQRFAYAKEGFDYKDNLINLSGVSAQVDLNSKDTDVEQADYQFVGRQGRGNAQHAELRQNYRVLKNATFTSCLPNDNSWSIEANEMRQHIKEEYAEMWHARFKVLGVPIFYTPYLQLPIGDRRRSGLLIPSVGVSSRDGYFYSQPIYWNIAPNFDMTITPKYMSKRGWQLNGETRYLTPIGEGLVAGEYLGRDRYDDYQDKDHSRYLLHWRHSSSFLDNWRLNVDYTRVSDKRYFSDFDSDYGNSTDGYADQNFRVAYYQPNYNFSLSAKQFQVFDEVNVGPYRVFPQLDFNYYRNDIANGLFDFSLFSQISRFENDSALMPKAWRYHIEPSINVPLANRYGSLNVETKLYATHYDQTKGSGSNAEEVKRSVNRVLPQVKVDFQTLLASKETLLKGYTQTLEPQVQYLYRPYRNQSDIGSKLNSQYLGFGYDSALLQQDYFSLFRDRRYSGLDRIASTNQFTLGGTTRFYDKENSERFNLSLGQIYYLADSRIDDTPQNSSDRSRSSWALESNWRMNKKWNWRASYQYDPSLRQTSLMNTVLEFNPSGDNLVQLSYRYASKQYIDQNLTGANAYNQDIRQLGLVSAWEIGDNWAMVGHYYQDLALKKPVEQYLGIKYNTCCWSVGLGARRYVTSKEGQRSNEIIYDNNFGVNVELRGLSSNQRSGIEKMLKTGKLPYIQSFSLY